MNQVVTPQKTEASHLSEWVDGSGVKQKLAELNLRSICDPKEIAQLLNWGAYHGTPGWYVMSVDLETGNFRRFGQLKPNVALLFPNAKKAMKYLCFPKGDGVEVQGKRTLFLQCLRDKGLSHYLLL